MEEWIQDTTNVESYDHNNKWIGEVIFRSLKKNQNVKYNCGKQGHLKRDCKQNVPSNNVFCKHN